MKRWMVFGAVIALAALGVWRSLTLYSNVAPDPVMDPSELGSVRRVLSLALRGDSAGAERAGATSAAARWALAAARRDSDMVRGWVTATETTNRAERGDTTIRTWFTTAAMQRCSGAAELVARLIHEGRAVRLVALESPCLPVAPITFDLQ